MNQIETLSAVRTQLEGRDDVLARNLELLEREREIVRREIDVVAELIGLEEQRVAAEVEPAVAPGPRADRAPVSEQVSPTTSASSADGQESQPASPAVPDPELWSGPAVAVAEAGVDQMPAAPPEPERPVPATAEPASAMTPEPEPATAEPDRGRFEPGQAILEPRDTEMLGRIEQLRRLRASLVMGSPAASSGRGD
ncbi:MAG: hypothetical protein ACP5VP_02660 [Candidatus Limnocylindrales bacterium]